MSDLAPGEMKKMRYLLGKNQVDGLSPAEEAELKQYITKKEPDAKGWNMDDLITLGLVIAGSYALYKIIQESAKSA